MLASGIVRVFTLFVFTNLTSLFMFNLFWDEFTKYDCRICMCVLLFSSANAMKIDLTQSKLKCAAMWTDERRHRNKIVWRQRKQSGNATCERDIKYVSYIKFKLGQSFFRMLFCWFDLSKCINVFLQIFSKKNVLKFVE